MNLAKNNTVSVFPLGKIGAAIGPLYLIFWYAQRATLFIPEWSLSLLASMYVIALMLGFAARTSEGTWSSKGAFAIPVISLLAIAFFSLYVKNMIAYSGTTWSGLMSHILALDTFKSMKAIMIIISLVSLPYILVIRFLNGALFSLYKAPNAPRWLRYKLLLVYRTVRHYTVIQFLIRHPYLVMVFAYK